jgi:hypothetical protein
MALKIKFSSCLAGNSEYLTFKELTGVYSNPANITGYGTPNPLYSNATAATLTIKDSEGTLVGTVNLFNDLPTNNITTEFIITNTQFGLTTLFLDGVYQITYKVTIFETLYKATQWHLFDSISQSSLEKFMLKIVQDYCDTCESTEQALNKYTTARMLLNAASAAADCGDKNKAVRFMDMFKKLDIDNCCN